MWVVLIYYNITRERSGVKNDVVTRIEKGMLQLFGHVEMIDVTRTTAQIYRANVDGNAERVHPEDISGSIW